MLDNEECWVLRGRRSNSGWFWKAKYDRYTVGQPARVAFDYNHVYAMEDAGLPILGWLHTHPHWTSRPSQTDHDTMQAWTDCLGRPLLCCILGVDGLRAWWYIPDVQRPILDQTCRGIGKRVSGIVPPAVRKAFAKKEVLSGVA